MSQMWRVLHVRGNVLLFACILACLGLPLGAQEVMDLEVRRRTPMAVLRNFPLSDTDQSILQLSQNLSLDSYKGLVRSLADFGERRQGTEQNVRAMDWIEETLRGWGYEPERHHYLYREEPRSQVFATKRGESVPEEMYIVSAHMDGIGFGEAANDNASGTALVMEIARVLAIPGVVTERSVRFVLWNNEETGLDGSEAYVADRSRLQGIESPPGSGNYPEPRWLGVIQHDKVLFDHGNPVQPQQVANADIDIEYQIVSEQWEESAQLAIALLNANRTFASSYPAVASNAMSNTDSAPFMNEVAAVSVRENRRLYEIGLGSDPNWHQPTDLFDTYSDADFLFGLDAVRTTFGAVARLAGVRVVVP